jgi:hypothetical protein
MSPNDSKPARPAKQQDAAEKLNSRVLKAQAMAKELQAALAASLGAGPKAPLATTLAEASTAVDALETAAREVSAFLLRLHKEKWQPPKKTRGFAVGARVAIRDGRMERFGGAWDKADLRSLEVTGVHGRKLKVQIVKDGLRGECVGLVHSHWLQPRAA